MKLHELKASKGANTAPTRKGRGAGSGNGKTAGYGHKGQKARSGVKKAGFEGGQMPLQRRLPKRGFNNIFATKYVIVKVSDLDKFEAGATIDEAALLEKGIISKSPGRCQGPGQWRADQGGQRQGFRLHGFCQGKNREGRREGRGDLRCSRHFVMPGRSTICVNVCCSPC